MTTHPDAVALEKVEVSAAAQVATTKESVEYTERQKRIDATLTSAVVESIVAEYGTQIAMALLSSKLSRHITLVYASTAALLRRIEGQLQDKVVGIHAGTLERERKRQPNSKVLADCDGAHSFCVTIATALPFALVPGAPVDTPNAILTQTMTCIKIPPALLSAFP